MIEPLLDAALTARQALTDETHQGAFRLFNGFTEGWPALSVDIYARTALIHDYADTSETGAPTVTAVQAWLLARLPWIGCIVVKIRNGDAAARNGMVVFGDTPDREITENGVRYAIDLLMNRDASLYLDTRNLRCWLKSSLAGKTLLNTFAYTGSLGVAALAGGATRVTQLDRNWSFLSQAKASAALNDVPAANQEFHTADFFPAISRLKRNKRTFDCVVLDPPFFSSTAQGRVDLEADCVRLINKVRPLINDGGCLVAINNALFVSGESYMAMLTSLCGDGYLSIEKMIPVSEDFTGFGDGPRSAAPANPAPFNHSTKIVVLRVRRKDAAGM